MPPGRVWVAAHVDGDTVHVTITDDGRGNGPRPDSPGLGLGRDAPAVQAAGLKGDGLDGRVNIGLFSGPWPEYDRTPEGIHAEARVR